MDESRKTFEQWAESNGHDTYRSIAGGGYYFQSTQLSWDIWQASRAAIEIELPEWFSPNDCGDRAMWSDDVEKAIRSAGIKVKE